MKTAVLLSPPRLPLQLLSATTLLYKRPHILCQSQPLMQPVSFKEMSLPWVRDFLSNQLSSVQSLSHVQLFATP